MCHAMRGTLRNAEMHCVFVFHVSLSLYNYNDNEHINNPVSLLLRWLTFDLLSDTNLKRKAHLQQRQETLHTMNK